MKFLPVGLSLLLILTLMACPSNPPVQKDPSNPLNTVAPLKNNPSDPSPSPQVFTVTQEVYDKTFKEIEELIETLNILIAQRKFTEWKGFLDKEAIDAMGDPKTLAEISERPILKKFNLKLKTINDYFTYVVVPSRSNAKLDEILFMDNNHVTAYTVIKGEKSILYQLRRDNSQWKITIW